MAVKRRFNAYSGIRLDIPHLRSVESAVSHDFDELLRGLFTGLNSPYLIRGFEVEIPTASINASSLKIKVADSAVLHSSATESGTILLTEANLDPEVLDSTNEKVIGSFQNGVPNYIGLDYRRVTDLNTVDNTAGWSEAQKLEFQRTAPIGRVLDYRFIISSSGFGSTLPLYIVYVSNTGAVQKITKGTPGLFRLGSGGANPDPQHDFAFGNLTNTQPGATPRREWVSPDAGITSNPMTVSPGDDPLAFNYGDWSVRNMKQWMDAVMTRFKEVTGSAYWYLDSNTGGTPGGGGNNIFDTWFDAVGSYLTGSGSLSYNYILEAIAPTDGAFQALSDDQSLISGDSFVEGATSGTRATLSAYNAAQLVINSITNPAQNPFLFNETLYNRRRLRMDYVKALLNDRSENSNRYGAYQRVSTNPGSPVAISSWSYVGREVTVVTGAAHGLQVGDGAAISGLTLSTTDLPPNGVFLVKQVLSATSFKYSAAFVFSGTAGVLSATSRRELAVDSAQYDFFRHPYLPRFRVSSWSYGVSQATLVVPGHNLHAPASDNGSVNSGSATISGLSSTANLRVGMDVVGPGAPAGAFIEEVLSSTSVRMSQPASSTTSGAYQFTDVIIVSGLTATTNAPNGRYRVAGFGGGQNEVLIDLLALPTGPAGRMTDGAGRNVATVRYNAKDFLLSVTDASPQEYNVTNAEATAWDDMNFHYLIGPDTLPTLGSASGPIVFDGVIAVSEVQNPIKVQSITNNGAGTLTVSTYVPHGLITTPGPIAFTIFGDSSASQYFRTYTGVSIQYIDALTFQIVGTGIISGASYTNVDTTTPPAWSSGPTYNVGDVVAYGGLYYKALGTNSNQQPDISPVYWEETYIDGTDPVFVKFSNNPYAGPIQWDSDLVVKAIIGDKRFVIPASATADGTPLANAFNVNGVAGTAYLQNGEVAYINLERNRVVSAGALFNASNGDTIVGAAIPTDDLGAPLRSGDFVRFDGEDERRWFRIAGTVGTPVASNTFQLVGDNGQPTTSDQRPAASGKLQYTKGYYTVVHVAPHWQVPASTDVYWLAFRRDNGSVQSKVYLKGLELEVGEVRQISDNTTNNLLIYTGANSESATNPNYSVSDAIGQYQFKQSLKIIGVDGPTRMISFEQGPDLNPQVGDQVRKAIGSGSVTYTIKQVLTSKTVIVNESLATISNITSISRAADGTVTVVTPAPHGLNTGDTAIISGVDPEELNSITTVTVVSPTSFTYSESTVFNGTTATGSDLITGVAAADVAKLKIGQTVSGTGVAPGAVILSFPTSTSVQVSANGTANGTSSLTATLAGVLVGSGGFVSIVTPLLLGQGDTVDYLRVNYVLNDNDNLTLGIRKEDRELAKINSALTRPIYDESFQVQRIDLNGNGVIQSGNYVYTGPANNPTFLAWVLHGTHDTIYSEAVEGSSVTMPGGHPSIGPNAILVAIISGAVTDGTALLQNGVTSGRTVNNPGNPDFVSPTIAGGISNDGVELALPPNRRTQVVGSSYVQWPSFMVYKASTNPALAGEELLMIINDSVRQAGVDYSETYGGPKGKIRVIRDLPANTRMRARLLTAYGSAIAAKASGVTLQTAYDASFINNYTVQELSGKPVIFQTGDQSTGGSALSLIGSLIMDSSFAGSVVGGIFGSADKKFDIGREDNKPEDVWAGTSHVKTHNSHPESDNRTFTAGHTTTTNAPSIIAGSNITVPVLGSGVRRTYRVKGKATANRSDGTLGVAAFEIHGVFYRDGSNALQSAGSPVSTVVGSSGDGNDYSLGFGISGNDIVLVGVGNGVVEWACTIEVQSVSLST